VPAGEPALSVEEVWNRLIDHAVDQRVDALVLTGDVADRDNAFFEAFGTLERGIGRLVRAGIPTIAVAGNHDFDVLGRLVRAIDSPLLTLLGAGGTWGTTTLERDGVAALRLVGWSFPQTHVHASPLPGLPEVPGDLPTIGVLHADLDQTESPYAPVRSTDLFATPMAAWLLGHIHVPALREASGRAILYPGSPQPLHPGETGRRGPWTVEVHRDGRVDLRQVPMATLRYETLDVPLDGVHDRDALEQHLVAYVQEALGRLRAEHQTLQRLVCRLSLTGRTRLHRDLLVATRTVVGNTIPGGDAEVVVDHVLVATRPDHDLEVVATRIDPAGALAQLLLCLDGGDLDEATRALVHRSEKAMEDVARTRAYQPLQDRLSSTAPGGHHDARARLRRQGLLLLDHLLSQPADQPTA
jgi:DNA repair protein SbcD/Mre11